MAYLCGFYGEVPAGKAENKLKKFAARPRYTQYKDVIL